MLQAYLPADLRAFRDAFVFTVVILILLLRPAGLIPTALVQRVERVRWNRHAARRQGIASRHYWPLLAL